MKCRHDVSYRNHARKLGDMMGEEQGGTEQQMDFDGFRRIMDERLQTMKNCKLELIVERCFRMWILFLII